MSDVLVQGLWISIIGMIILFMAMGLLCVLMILLDRLTRGRAHAASQEEAAVTTDTAAPEPVKTDEIAAAIAVSIAYLRSQDRGKSSLGSTLDTGVGPWWRPGRVQQAPRRRPEHHNGETGYGLR